MMKRIRFNFLAITGLSLGLFCLFAVSSCMQPVEQEKFGRIVLKVYTQEAISDSLNSLPGSRTAGPNFPSPFDEYKVSYSSGSVTRAPDTFYTNAPELVLEAETWDITVDAIHPAGSGLIVASGTLPGVTISTGDNGSQTVNISPSREGTGDIDVTIAWPDTVTGIASVEGKFDVYPSPAFPANVAFSTPVINGSEYETTFSSNGGTYVSGEDILPVTSGDYLLTVLLKDGDSRIMSSLVEVVKIFDNWTTPVDITLEPGNIRSVPAVPTGLSALQTAYYDRLRVEWDHNISAEGYVLERKLSTEDWSNTGHADYKLVNDLGSGITYYIDTGLADSTTYDYHLKAVNSFGESLYTDPAVSGTTIDPGSQPLDIQLVEPSGTEILFAQAQDIALNPAYIYDIEVSNTTDFQSAYVWYLDGNEMAGETGSSVTIDCIEYSVGVHHFAVFGQKAGSGEWFSETLRFNIDESLLPTWRFETAASDDIRTLTGLGAKIQVDSTGVIHIHYTDYGTGGSGYDYDGWYVKKTTSGWEAPYLVADSYYGGTICGLALDSGGDPWLTYSWGDYVGSGGINFRYYDSGWVLPLYAIVGNYRKGAHVIVIDGTDTAHVIANEGTDLVYRHHPDGAGSWTVGPIVTTTADSVDFQDLDLDVDGDNKLHASYFNAGNSSINYAYYNGASWALESIEGGSIGSQNGLAVDGNNKPHISYYDSTSGDLKYAWHDGTNWRGQVNTTTPDTVDSTGDVGSFNDIGLDSSGNPYIVYYDADNEDLKMAKWSGSVWEIETVDFTGDVGIYCSMDMDQNDAPHVVYRDVTNGMMKYAVLVVSGGM
jgi:hypothetical protein